MHVINVSLECDSPAFNESGCAATLELLPTHLRRCRQRPQFNTPPSRFLANFLRFNLFNLLLVSMNFFVLNKLHVYWKSGWWAWSPFPSCSGLRHSFRELALYGRVPPWQNNEPRLSRDDQNSGRYFENWKGSTCGSESCLSSPLM